MKGQDINSKPFKKLRKHYCFPFSMPDNTYKYNKPSPLKKQYFSSHIGGLVCLTIFTQQKRKKQGYFVKQ